MSHEQNSPPSEVSREVSKAISAVRARFADEAPTDVTSEVKKDRIDITLHNAPPPSNPGRYRSAAISALTRVTKRKVSAMISKQEKGSDVATEVFLFDVPTARDADKPLLKR